MRTEPVFGSLAQTCRLHSKSPLSGLECNQNVTPTRAPDAAGCEPLDDIAEDHVTYSDRRAEDRGQNKVHTADDRCHGSSLKNERTPYLWNTHECNNYKVTFGTRPVQLPEQAANRESCPRLLRRCRFAVHKCSGWERSGFYLQLTN